jgi:hypothetical protein
MNDSGVPTDWPSALQDIQIQPVSYVDSIVLHLPRLMGSEVFEELGTTLENPRKQIVHKQIARPNGSFFLKMSIHQPNLATLNFLNDTRKSYRIMQVHIALDLVTATASGAIGLHRYMQTRLIKSGRPAKLSYWHVDYGFAQEPSSIYLGGRVRRGVELILYSDRKSKAIKVSPCLHIEWRLMGAEHLRKMSLSSAQQIINLDHRDFWNERLRLWKPPSFAKLLEVRSKQLAKYPVPFANEATSAKTAMQMLRAAGEHHDGEVVTSDLLHMLHHNRHFSKQPANRLFTPQNHDWMLPSRSNALWKS